MLCYSSCKGVYEMPHTIRSSCPCFLCWQFNYGKYSESSWEKNFIKQPSNSPLACMFQRGSSLWTCCWLAAELGCALSPGLLRWCRLRSSAERAPLWECVGSGGEGEGQIDFWLSLMGGTLFMFKARATLSNNVSLPLLLSWHKVNSLFLAL